MTTQRYAVLSIFAALVTIGLKLVAYFVTGSVGLLSDALESVVNLIAAFIALWALTVADRPADEEHAYGHSKVEYFASGAEGALILLAAASIGLTAWERLRSPQPLEQVGLGLVISIVAAAVNGGVALILLRAGQRLRSPTLEADAHHLLTDVWTTAGVVVGVLIVGWTGWLILDPLIAIIVALNIVWTGVRLLRRTGYGLLDTALPTADQEVINSVLAPYRQQGISFHALRTRMAGARRFVSMHVLVPGDWSVRRGHGLAEEVELALHDALPGTTVFTHLEPLEDPIAWEDQGLDRLTRRG
ncbi:MAG: cation transporter [Anaerolineae bacterium]|nr:cation transporter [Anaerolineae bacterium]